MTDHARSGLRPLFRRPLLGTRRPGGACSAATGTRSCATRSTCCGCTTSPPLAVGPPAYVALVRLDVVPPFARECTRRHRVGMAIGAAALGVAGAGEADAPPGRTVRLIRDGRAVPDAAAELRGPATYRVELPRRGASGPVPWLLPSPVRAE